MEKPYRGEIYDWSYLRNPKNPKHPIVHGFQYKSKSSPMKADDVCLINTSAIVDVVIRGDARLIETANSIYCLVGPPKTGI